MKSIKGKLSAKQYLLALIIVLAAFLRLWQLGSIPPSVSIDEASIGYNAYSVIKTGLDEYGSFPLVSQRGYDDWRRSTYLFLTIPFIKLFGLNAVSIRLPSVILSILTILAIYFIVLRLFPKQANFPQNLALSAAFLLAISPWHIYISRLGHESNAYLSFFVFGLLFFYWGFKNKPLLIISAIFLLLSTVSYYAGQVFIPPFIFGLILIYRENIFSAIKSSRAMIFATLTIGLVSIPIFWNLFSHSAMIRYQGTSIFNPGYHYQELIKLHELKSKAMQNNDYLGKILYSDRLFNLKVIVSGYFSHFNFSWLTTNPAGNDPFKAPGLGLIDMWWLIFGLAGMIILLFNNHEDKKTKLTVYLWLILAPLPGAVATQAPHAMRAYTLLPVFIFFSAIGAIFILEKLSKYKTAVLLTLLMFVTVSLAKFYRNYFIRFPKEQSAAYSYDGAKAFAYAFTQQNKYQKIVFSNQKNLYQSYMLYLYYSKYDPEQYQLQGGTVSGGFARFHKIGKYEFRPIVWSSDKLMKDTLLIGNVSEFPRSIIPAQVFRLLNGETTLIAAGT